MRGVYEMGELLTLKEIDWFNVAVGVIALFLFFKFCVSSFEWLGTKYGLETKRMRQRREDHELLVKTSTSLLALKERHENDENKHEKDEADIKNALADFINETRNENDKLRQEMLKFAESRVQDKQQSLEIQKELSNSIQAVVAGQEERDQQIQALMCGSKELLGITIDSLYSHYVELGGIPENEVDEFNDIFSAYDKLKGNGKRRAKYEYVKEHLPVIPVETKLIFK